MTRNFLGIIAGYSIFVAASLSFFKLSGHDPHSDSTTLFIILTATYGVFFSCIAGFITQFIANTKKLKTNFVLALIIAGFATFSYYKSDGSNWTQILAIFIFAPASILGGLFYNKRQKDNAGNY